MAESGGEKKERQKEGKTDREEEKGSDGRKAGSQSAVSRLTERGEAS